MQTSIRKLQLQKDQQRHKVIRRIKKRNKNQQKQEQNVATEQMQSQLRQPSFNCGKDGGSGIHIKKKNRGKFTSAAKKHGMGVQQFANKVLRAPKGKYSTTLRKRANFARNASKFKH